MGGEGSMAHAIQSLKMNKRGKTNFLASEDNLYSYGNDPLGQKVASPEELQAIDAKIARLKAAETRRVYLAIIGTLLLAVGALVYFLL